MRPLLAALALLLVAAPAARAHDQPGLHVELRREARRLVVSLAADDGAMALAGRVEGEAFLSATRRAMSLRAADGGPVVLAGRQAAGDRVVFEGVDPGGDLLLSLSLFGGDDEGEAFVRIGDGADARALRVELPGVVRWEQGAAPAPGADVTAFVVSGVEHIATGYDHLAFLLVLVVVSRRLTEVVRVATAFTLAHSVTLALAAFDVVRVPSAPVESAIAASIVAAALGNVLAPQAGHRTTIAFAFGLVHGLGFSSGLAELLEGAAASRVSAVLGFNLGVEAGQLAVLVVAAPLLVAWRRRAPVVYGRVCVRAASVAVAALGLFWLVERVRG